MLFEQKSHKSNKSDRINNKRDLNDLKDLKDFSPKETERNIFIIFEINFLIILRPQADPTIVVLSSYLLNIKY